MRRLAQALISSARYPSSVNVQVIKSGKSDTFSEVKTRANWLDWMKAMQDEMKSLHDNYTYKLVAFLKGKRTLRRTSRSTRLSTKKVLLS